MVTERLHQPGETARLDHTQHDIRFAHFIEWTEVLMGLATVTLLVVVAALMIFL